MTFPTTMIGTFIDERAASLQTGPFGTQLKASDYVHEGAPVINVRNIGYGELRQEKLEYVGEATRDRLAIHVLTENDIVFGRKGAVDRHLLVTVDNAGWLQGSDCIRLRFVHGKINPRYISYTFLSGYHKKWMLQHSGNKATMASLNQDIIRRIEIPLPPQDIQNAIVSAIAPYDELLRNNLRRIGLLEEAAQMLYREWFVRLRFPGHEHVKINDGIPEGWERQPLIALAEIVMGQSPKSQFYNESGNGLPFHQGVTDYGFRFVSHHTYSTKVTKIAEANDILVSVRAPVGRINVTRDKIVLGRGLAAVRPRDQHSSFLFYALKNHFFAEDIIGTGAIYAATNKTELENQMLLIPSHALLREFDDQAHAIDSQIKCLTAQNEKLTQARDILLPRLMSGEIAV